MPTKPRRVMAQASIPEDTLKQAMKEALTETFAEERDLFREVVVEALEDFALAEAIEEGQQTEKVSRERILDTLEGGRT
jgi:thermostable 8-oxoguanine DNA glycosylase